MIASDTVYRTKMTKMLVRLNRSWRASQTTLLAKHVMLGLVSLSSFYTKSQDVDRTHALFLEL